MERVVSPSLSYPSNLTSLKVISSYSLVSRNVPETSRNGNLMNFAIKIKSIDFC